jgi:hypothetical protein
MSYSPNCTISRIDHRSGYTKLANDFFRDHDLSRMARLVLGYFLSNSEQWYVKLDQAAKQLGMCRATLSKYIEELITKGRLIRDRVRQPNGFFAGYRYRVFEQPVALEQDSLPEPVLSMPTFSAVEELGAQKIGVILKTNLTNNQINQETSTNYTLPTGVCDELEVFETSFVEQDPEPEPCLNKIPSPIAAMNLTSTNSPSSEEDLPAATTNITAVTQIPDCDLGSTARFDRQIRTYQDSAALTEELVKIYNQIKPEHWGKCTTTGTHLPRQVAALVRRYGDAQLVIQEWGEACLGAKANEFYNSAAFKNGNINFLLDPTKTDRIPQLAQAWRDRPQVQKEQLAKKMVAAANGIPTWGNPDVQLKGMLLHFARKEYAGYIASGNFNHPDCPDLDYLKTYFAELF